jgi:hypothetical protein
MSAQRDKNVVMHPVLERLVSIESHLEILEERQMAIGHVLAWILNEIGKDKSFAFLGRIANEAEEWGDKFKEFVAEFDEIRGILRETPAFQESNDEKKNGASS